MSDSMPSKLPPLPELPSAVTEVFRKLKESSTIKEALKQIKLDEQLTIEDQIALTEVEAPPFHEDERGKFFAEKLRTLGLTNVRTDAEGNVIGTRPGSGNGPRLVIGAHLDTVFPQGTNVKVRREGKKYYAPGISDDARGLAVVLEVLRILEQFKIQTDGDLLFVGSVGEEGNGDLRGGKYLFGAKEEHIDGFISIDSADVSVLLHGSTGSRRFRVTYEGPGGHSWAAFGTPSAVHALGRAIAKIAELQVPAEPKTTFTVGTIIGGTTVNSIAAKATMEIDTRSINNDELNKIVDRVLPLLSEACEEENKRWNATAENEIKVVIEPIGHRPAGDQPHSSPVLLAARAAMDSVGIKLCSYCCASTDQNVPLSLGIPATTLGGGGSEGHNHSVTEWYDSTDSFLGPQLALMTVLSLVGVKNLTSPLLPKRQD